MPILSVRYSPIGPSSRFGFTYGEIDDDGNVLGMLWFPSFIDSEEGIERSPSSNLRQIMTLPAVAQSTCYENDPVK